MSNITFSDVIGSIIINCEVRKYATYPKVDRTSSFADAIVINVSYDFKLDDFNYESFFAYNCSDLASLKSSKQPLHYLPENIYETYPKLASLTVTEAGLRKIRYENLRLLWQLQNLDLQSNKIEILESNLFTDNSNLQIIILKNNKLHSISPESFDNLNQIREINFAANECIDKAYYFGNLNSKPELQNDLTETCTLKQHQQIPLIDKKYEDGIFGKMEKYCLAIIGVCLYFIVDLSASVVYLITKLIIALQY